MTIMKRDAIAVSALAAVMVLAAGARAEAEGQSWLCQYIPSACASEDNPGGLPGHAKEGAATESGSAARGVSTDAEPAAQPAPPPIDDAAPDKTDGSEVPAKD